LPFKKGRVEKKWAFVLKDRQYLLVFFSKVEILRERKVSDPYPAVFRRTCYLHLFSKMMPDF
jgi:hypothetical protein